MVAQAQAEFPNECCGLLAGSFDSPERALVSRRYPLVNAAASPVEYLSDARSMFDAERDRARRGLELLAVYHSHPASEPVPSRKDREQNYSPEVMNLIISLQSPGPLLRAWWLTAEGQREGKLTIVEDGGEPG
jgi:proteasome lid subunit RPN8/RPN11